MITEHSYGLNKDGEKISLFKIKNSNKIEVHIINYGATITSIFTPDRENNFNDIVFNNNAFYFFNIIKAKNICN